jgi:putative phosphonate metabolism protein
MSARFAIYFTLAEQDPLYRLASMWLQHDVYSDQPPDGSDIQFPDCLLQYLGLTSEASTYGFHATLKAPFRLRPDKTKKELIAALDEFCRQARACECAPLQLSQIGSFLALTPAEFCEDLQLLASQCVEAFEPFRAELKPQEYERRRPEQLTQRQRLLLDQWGYPYVFDEFRFHMTLTDKLEPQQLQPVYSCLKQTFDPLLGKSLIIDRLYLFYQKKRSQRFRIIHSQKLRR